MFPWPVWGNKNQLTIVLCHVLQNLGNETYWRICISKHVVPWNCLKAAHIAGKKNILAERLKQVQGPTNRVDVEQKY
jgi:hypothetical protein